MTRSVEPHSDDVDQLMLNAQLRDELEPFVDESTDLLNLRSLPTPAENEFLASMLAWERAPALPIGKWFEPELNLPRPDSMNDEQLHEVLWNTIHRLCSRRIVLDFTDHLSDRQLYCLIFRDILPSYEKKIELPKNYLHWHCLDIDTEAETWLRYYATEDERIEWTQETGQPVPTADSPPYSRKMPRRPQA